MDDGDNGVDNDECWPHIIYPIYVLGLMLFPPEEVFSRAGAWLTIRIKIFQNHDAFTQRSFNTEKLLHTETFAHRNSEADAHRNFYAKKSLQRSFYTQKLLHTEALGGWRREGGCPKLCALRPWTHVREWKAPSYTIVSEVAPAGGESEARTWWEYYFALWLLLPCGYFAHRAASPCGLITNVSLLNSERPPKHSELIRARNANGFQMLATSLSNLGKMLGHHFHPHRNVETAQPSEVEYIRMNTLHEESTGAL